MLFENINMMYEEKIGILMPFRKTPWSGSFRVMVNFCKATKDKDRIIFILFKGNKELKKYVEDTAEVETSFIETYSELKELIRRKSIKMLVGDDHPPRLKILAKIKKDINMKTLIYVQFLYGISKIFPIFEQYSLKEKLKNSVLKIYPWFMIRTKFKNLLSKHDILIANSKSTATLLQLLYGLPVNGIAYPLVDTRIFKPKIRASEEVVTIYSGSKAGDTSLELLKKIVDILLSYRKVVNIFGENVEVIKRLITSKSNVKFFKNVSDDELAEIYSRSYFTIAPQIFELFGYVPIESMACGTPVLAFNLLGPSETVLNGKTGWLVLSENEFIDKLRHIINTGYDKKMREVVRRYVVEKFSVEKSLNNCLLKRR